MMFYFNLDYIMPTTYTFPYKSIVMKLVLYMGRNNKKIKVANRATRVKYLVANSSIIIYLYINS